MKKFVFILSFIVSVASDCMAIDPLLTSAVIAGDAQLKSEYDKRKKLQEKILAAEVVIGAGLHEIHNVENQILTYMSHATSALQNVHDLKEITLITADIYTECDNIRKAIKENPKGAVLAGIGSKKIKEATEEIVSCSTLIQNLVLTGKVNKDDEEKVNMLSAAERYNIINTVRTSLNNVKRDLWIFACQVRYWTVIDLWMHLDYESWAKIVGMEYNARYAIRLWNNTFNK